MSCRSWIAQRRPGHQPRRHPPARWRSGRRGVPLNEGRGINPGDTGRESAGAGVWRGFRSTKAGASTPATHAARAGNSPAHMCAQRRPGHQPRRHTVDRVTVHETDNAQRRPGHQPRRHVQGDRRAAAVVERSTKAGASTPATPAELPQRRTGLKRAQRRPGHQPRRHAGTGRQARGSDAALNEGRGINPGDTPSHTANSSPFRIAQRRPGHQPRRHPAPPENCTSGTTSAQRRPGHQPRRHRSLAM